MSGRPFGFDLERSDWWNRALTLLGPGIGGGCPSGGEGVDVETTETELGNGCLAVDGFTYRNDWVSSDERLTGAVTGVTNWVVGPDGSDAWGTAGQPDIIVSQVIELTNDGGSWLAEGIGFGSTDLDITRDMYTLLGQRGYD